MDWNFFLLLMIAVFAYGIQTPLLTVYARKYDSITVAIYRNVSLAVLMSPVLLFAPSEDFARAAEYVLPIAFMAVVGGGAYIVGLSSATYLPVGIAQSFRQASSIIASIFLGAVVLAEYLSGVELILIVLLLTGIVALSLLKTDVVHLKRQNISLGIWLAIGSGIASAASFLIFTSTSRQMSPLITGYFLELGVAIAAIMFATIRWAFFGQRVPLLPSRDVKNIALISSIAIVATLGFGYAVTIGTFAIASALLGTSLVVSLVTAWIFFKERLSLRQVSIIIFMLCVVVALQFAR